MTSGLKMAKDTQDAVIDWGVPTVANIAQMTRSLE